MTPALIKAIRDEEDAPPDEFSAPQRAAMLAFSGELQR
jgi:hypothetical protein